MEKQKDFKISISEINQVDLVDEFVNDVPLEAFSSNK